MRVIATIVSLKDVIVREEKPEDIPAIRDVIGKAFASAPHSSGTEATIVDVLRRSSALAISLVALVDGAVTGHVAVSPLAQPSTEGWFGLGPVAVLPKHQSQGIGATLIENAMTQLRARGAAGCVVLGEPSYYRRFGFTCDPAVTYRDVPSPYFQVLAFGLRELSGPIEYHPAFG